jgi:hypothetical protein
MDVEKPFPLTDIPSMPFVHTPAQVATEAWVKYQASKGNYEETKIGKATTQWTVTINRTLKAAPPGMTSGVEGQ